MPSNDPLDNLSAAFTPQDLAVMRSLQQQQQMQDANSNNSPIGAIIGQARTTGLALGGGLASLGPDTSTLGRIAAQNQAILTAPNDSSAPDPSSPDSQAPSGGSQGPTGVSAPASDPYAQQAADYASKARAFLAAGNPNAAMQFHQASLATMAAGAKAQQQAALTAQEQSRSQQEDAKTADIQAKAQYVLVDTTPDKNGIPQYKTIGQPISLYGGDDGATRDPMFGSKVQAALAAAQQNGSPNARVMSVGDLESSKANAASIRAAASAAKAQAGGGGAFANDPDALDQATGAYALNGPAALTRMTGADRAAVLKNLTTHGLTFQDAAEARLQYGALAHAVNTGAARAGRVAFLANEIPAQAQNVLDALNGVDRTKVQALNSAIAGGKTAFSDPGEARYATAIQGLLTPYSLLIAGATGQSSDAARTDAYSILTKQQGPDAVKGVIDQIVNRELTAAKNAGDATIEMARNSRRYSALAKVAAKMGVPLDSAGTDGPAADTPPVVAPAANAAPPQAGAPAPDSGGFVPGKQYKDKSGNTATYLGNGKWQ